MLRRNRAPSESDPLLGPSSQPQSYLDTTPTRKIKRKNEPCCAPCCVCWSALCCLFLVWIGIYATLGWSYMQRGWTPAQVPTVQRNSFLGALCWCITGCISLVFWRRQVERNERYTEMTIVRERGD